MTSQSINAFLEDIGEVMKGVLMGSLVVAGGAIGWATASLPQYWRLPQAAPSLSRSASSQVSLSRPYGLQSTIAGDTQ